MNRFLSILALGLSAACLAQAQTVYYYSSPAAQFQRGFTTYVSQPFVQGAQYYGHQAYSYGQRVYYSAPVQAGVSIGNDINTARSLSFPRGPAVFMIQPPGMIMTPLGWQPRGQIH